MIVYHGTTKSNLKRIIEGKGKGVGPWALGDINKMYFVDLKSPKSYKSKKVDPSKAIGKAFDQANLQACMNEDIDLYVLECDIPQHLIEPDESFEDANDCQINVKDFCLSFIKKIHHIKINKYCKPRYLIGMWENGCCNRDKVPLDLREYVDKVIMDNSRTDRPRHILEDELIDFSKWKTKAIPRGN